MGPPPLPLVPGPVSFYKPVILMCPSSSRRMLKERGENRCLKETGHGGAWRPQGRLLFPDAAFRSLSPGQSSHWVRSVSRSTACGGTKGHLSPCAAAPGTHWGLRLETFTSPGGGSRVIGTERAQGCPGLWSLRGGFL